MRFGVCTGTENAALLAENGGDYLELGVASGLMGNNGDEAWWTERQRVLKALPVPVETFNIFLPGSLRLVGPDEERTDKATIREYVFTALRRAAEIGGKVIVFGSGGARRVPEGFSRETASEQLRKFLHICAKATEETGVIIAIEPLNRGECNIINSVEEAATEYAAVLNHPGIRVLADTYHMERENEPLSVLPTVASYLAHVHTADTERLAPGTGTYDHVALFRTLQEIGYDSRVSIEAQIPALATQVGPALTHLRQSYQEAM